MADNSIIILEALQRLSESSGQMRGELKAVDASITLVHEDIKEVKEDFKVIKNDLLNLSKEVSSKASLIELQAHKDSYAKDRRKLVYFITVVGLSMIATLSGGNILSILPFIKGLFGVI